MTHLRVYLVAAFTLVTGYAFAVGLRRGWDYVTPFFASIAELSWPGQFNVDLLALLGLCGVWVAWRHRFSWRGILLGLGVVLGGTMFLAPYLLWASVRARRDARVLLLGEHDRL